jgi:hypothetical protein
VDVARRLAPGHLVSLSGGSAAYIAIVAAIFGLTGSALWVSAAIFSGVVASVASAPGAGWIGDRLDRRRVLIGSDVAAAAVSLAMAATAKQAAALVVLIGVSSIAQSPSSRRRPRRYGPSCPRKSWYAGGSPAPATCPSRCGGARTPAHVAMQLVGRGEAVNVVQALLGHASLSSTQIYIRAAGHQVREAAHALPAVVASYGGIRRDTTSG